MADPSSSHPSSMMEAIKTIVGKFKVGTAFEAIPIPSFFLEANTILEAYTDCCKHPALFAAIDEGSNSLERMIAILTWIFSGLAIRSSSKKPLNPALGETFKCSFAPASSPSSSASPGAAFDKTIFVAESVCTVPATAAFFLHNEERKILYFGDVASKAKFLGTSISLKNEGCATLVLGKHDETYHLTFPGVNVRGILTLDFRIEYVGTVEIYCPKTKLQAIINFQSKPMLMGKWDKVDGLIVSHEEILGGMPKELAKFSGIWSERILVKIHSSGAERSLWDSSAREGTKCQVVLPPEEERDVTDSTIIWKLVKQALSKKDYETATKERKIVADMQETEQWLKSIGTPPADALSSSSASSASRFPAKYFIFNDNRSGWLPREIQIPEDAVKSVSVPNPQS